MLIQDKVSACNLWLWSQLWLSIEPDMALCWKGWRDARITSMWKELWVGELHSMKGLLRDFTEGKRQAVASNLRTCHA